MTDDAPPASPADTLRLIEAERAAAARSMQPDPRLTYLPWGVAWFVAYALYFLRFGPDGRVFVPMPAWLPMTTLFVLLAAALVVSTWGGMRTVRHVEGESSIRGMQYGLTWFASFTGAWVIAGRVGDALPPEQEGLLWSALSVGVVGALIMAGSAVWQSWEMFFLGGWITVANIAGVIAGPGWHSLVICLAGGGGLMAVGLAAVLLMRRREKGPTPWYGRWPA